ncbi:retrovirus-related pol polyprotein from transposon TNT 1-94 [Tanacetum coccineum]
MTVWLLYMANTIMKKIYVSETQRITNQPSSSKALISNNHFQDSDSDVEEDQRTSNEFMADLNAEYHERALLANQKRFYKRSGRVGSARKPIGKSKDIWKNEKGKSEKGLIAESFDWDGELVSLEDEGTTRIRAFMVIVEDEPSVGMADARSGQWVDIAMKKVHRLLSMTDGDERNHVLDYTYVYLLYISLKDEIYDLKKVIEKCACSKLTLEQLLSEQIPGNIVKPLGGRGKRKEKISSKDIIFTKVNESSSLSIPKITSNSESKCKTQEPLQPLPNMSLRKRQKTNYQLSLNLALTRKLTHPLRNFFSLSNDCRGFKKQNTWFGPCKHYGFGNHLFDDFYSKPKCSTCGSSDHLTKEHLEHAAIKKIIKLKAQSPLNPTPNVAHKLADYPKKHPNSRRPRIANNGCSRHMTGIKQYVHKYSKESGPKVIFGDDSSGDIEGYNSVNCNGITFTRVAYVNGLKHNLISISQLCDANFKVLFTKTQEASQSIIQNKEIIDKSLHHLHMDLFGPIKPQTISHNKYALVIVDEYSRYNWVFCLKKKSDAADCVMSFIKKMENLNEVRVKELRSDNGTEFRNHKLEEFCDEKENGWRTVTSVAFSVVAPSPPA